MLRIMISSFFRRSPPTFNCSPMKRTVSAPHLRVSDRILHPFLISAAKAQNAGMTTLDVAKRVRLESWRCVTTDHIIVAGELRFGSPEHVINYDPQQLSLKEKSMAKMRVADILMQKGLKLPQNEALKVVLLGNGKATTGLGGFSFDGEITGFEYGERSFQFPAPLATSRFNEA